MIPRLFARNRSAPTPWNNLLAAGLLGVCLIVLLMTFRAWLIWHFRHDLAPGTDFKAFARCLGTGLRYDVQTVCFALLPVVLLAVLSFFADLGRWPERVWRTTLCLTTAACALIFVVDTAYFHEYQDQFNHWIFGMVYDDQTAILKTIWKSYPILWLGLGLLAVISAVIGIIDRLMIWLGQQMPAARYASSKLFKWAVLVLVTALMVVGMRGSAGRRPLQLKDAATTGEELLNKLVLNPFMAFKYAVEQHRRLETSAGLGAFLKRGSIAEAAHSLFPDKIEAISVDECFLRVASGCQTKPRHIFLVVGESYDAWPMESRFAAWGLTEQLKQLGREGIMTTAFVSAGTGTMPSINAIVTGLPFTDVNANYQPSVRNGLATAIAPIFKQLGYRPRFFYSGYLSWQRLGDFCKEQGFEEVYGGDKMSSKLSGNEWGVDDDVLYRFVLDHTSEEPTFNLILTTSYHPPFSVDLKAKGFPAEKLAAAETGVSLTPEQVRIYGHLWFADQSLGRFARDCIARHPDALLALTGDHYSRRFPEQLRPTTYEHKAVPLVLYGPAVLADIPRPGAMAGSHLDIVPTLINLAAPAGFNYHSAGRNLLNSESSQLGFGAGVIIGTNFIINVDSQGRLEDFQGRPFNLSQTSDALKLQYQQLHALGWWRIMQGNTLSTNSIKH